MSSEAAPTKPKLPEEMTEAEMNAVILNRLASQMIMPADVMPERPRDSRLLADFEISRLRLFQRQAPSFVTVGAVATSVITPRPISINQKCAPKTFYTRSSTVSREYQDASQYAAETWKRAQWVPRVDDKKAQVLMRREQM